ncbi:UDP-glucuronosyltransferase 2B19-like isoform X2 [Photinus pyralis]|uniref:UDP-glucuronosyltransferase 2B19-like isoform X2 n=1 Tax=Photinus pyralis TaxID=7054 RepID=UPI0012673CC2|nr:UDP-glucuronosyltransferase 2B19-like isoform X2 [Photinus pyralis]
MFTCVLVVFKLCIASASGAKILGFFFIPFISHQTVFQPIWRELSLRGHEVTVVTPNPLNDPTLTNLTEIDVGIAYEIVRRINVQGTIPKHLPIKSIIHSSYQIMSELVKAELEHPKVQALIRNQSRSFDLVMVEYLHPTLTALGARFKCPWVGITSLGALLPVHDTIGNPSHPVLNPDIILPFTGSMGFYERLVSVYFSMWFRYYYHYHIVPEQDKVGKKLIGEDLPYLGDIEKSISLLFLNVNPILHPIRPNVPAVIELGQMHLRSQKPLPKDLQQSLDKATEGVAYFSLGSNVRSANLSLELREKIITALSELPYTVLWKWEEDHLPNQPKNVIINKWLPQQDLLTHPNVKVFVMQGGLQSMEEAISGGVPLVGMPFFGDQPLNCMKMVNLGIALSIDTETLTSEDLKKMIIEVAENPKYRKRVEEIRELLFDVPATGLEKAIWWIEYVIRHKGAAHLRSPAVDLPFYQYYLLDVIGLVLAGVAVVLFIARKLFKLFFGNADNFVRTKHKHQ